MIRRTARVFLLLAFIDAPASAALVSVNAQDRHQTIDGFGTALSWWTDQPYDSSAWQSMYYQDMGSSMLRTDLPLTALSSDGAANPSDADLSTPITLGADTYQN